MKLRALLLLARRSVIGVLRQPGLIVPSIAFPMLFAALNAASFERATDLPGFPPVDSFLDFVLAATVCQGVVFGAINSGNDMAIDIQHGFFDRLAAAPIPRWVILVGRLAGGGALGGIQAVTFIVVLSLFGASVDGGLASMVGIVLVAVLLAVAVGGFGTAIALRTGSAEVVQAFFPVFFVSLFTSSAFFPRPLMTGWIRRLAGWNPLSWVIEDLRHLVIVGFDLANVVQAVAVVAGVGVVSVTIAGRALRWRTAGL